MDIIKWIKKNNFKDIDEELSDQIDNLNVLQSEKDKLISKIKSYKTTLKSLKDSLDIVNGEISKVNKMALKSLKVLPIIFVSIKFFGPSIDLSTCVSAARLKIQMGLKSLRIFFNFLLFPMSVLMNL